MMRLRRFTALLMAGILMLGCLTSCAENKKDTAAQIYSDFRDIPGVTQAEIDAVESLREKGTSLTYGMLFTTEAFIKTDGSCGGYSALFANWMSNLFGLNFETKIYGWDELMEGFEDGSIDFTGELTATPERRQKYFMTDTFTERAIKAFCLRGSGSLEDIAEDRPLRYAFLEGTTTIDAVTSVSEYPVETVLVPSEEAAIEKLHTGEVDAFMAEEHGEAMMPDDMIGLNIFPVVYSPISFSTAKEELEPIISVLDKYLKNGAFTQLIDLYAQGNQEYQKYKFYSKLTEEEQAYLSAHQEDGIPVPVLAEFDTYPTSFYNTKEKAWQGISIDVLNEIEALSGLNFQIINTPDEKWASLFEKLKSGEGAVITELIYSPEREGHFIWTDAPYSTDYYALISLNEKKDITLNEILYSKVGFVKESAYKEVFTDWFPDHQAVYEYEATGDAFAALGKGEIDLLMASRNLLLSATNYDENPSFKVNMMFDRTFTSSFGFHKDEAVLCSIVSKAQELVGTRGITERWTRKTFDYRGKMARLQVTYLIILSGLLICSIILMLLLLLKNRQMNKKLEATVKVRTAQLEVASKAKGDFLSRMSHEIRTPLNAIIGMAHIAKQSAKDESPKTVRSINEMLSASSHLLGILNDVLDMSKIEAGKFTLSHEPFALLPAFEDVKNIIAQRCAEKELHFECVYEQLEDIAVTGDNLRLKQVLINLLGNAVKFTPSGGNIRLSARAEKGADDRINLDISVRDTGIGMNEEQASRLFTAFEQADSNIASKFGGTGLGLAISQNLVMQMGGEITVETKPDKGSVFSFTLSLESADMPVAEDDSIIVDHLNLSGKHILLAEDIEINRVILLELLKDTGADFIEAENGAEAVRIFSDSAQGFFDLIFMDVQMPEMDGYEATEKIRALPRGDAPTVPIIAMTANAYREDVENALNSGMNGHLAKPVDLTSLLKLVNEILREQPLN